MNRFFVCFVVVVVKIVTAGWGGGQGKGMVSAAPDVMQLGSRDKPSFFRDGRNANNSKTCILEGVGEGEIYGKLSKNAVFSRRFYDNRIWKFCEFYCQIFCCHLGGS